MVRWVALISLVVACGGTGTRAPRKPGDEYLSAIRIEGNKAIDSDDLIPRLGLEHAAEAQRAVDDYQLQLDTQRIAAAFQKLGYFAVDVRSRVERKGDAITVTFTVVQGKRATTHVEITGLPSDVPLAKARKLIALADGAPFDYAAYDDAKDPMQRLLEDAGYVHVHIESTVVADRKDSTATIQFAIDPGVRATFGAIEIKGVPVDGMLADSVRARLTFHTGDHYSTSAVLATQNAIYGMGQFATVRIDPDREGNSAVVGVKLTLTELTKNEASAGGGFGADPLTYSIRVRGSYARRGVLTPLTTFAFDARPELAFEHIDHSGSTCGFDLWNCKRDPRIRLLATLTQQDLFLTDLKGQVQAGYDYLEFEAYTRTGPRFRAGLSTPIFTNRLQASVGWQFLIQDFPKVFIDNASAVALGIEKPNRTRPLPAATPFVSTTNYVGAYTAALSLDLRDKPIEPTRGAYLESRVAKGTPWAAGSFDYLQVTSEARGFVPVGPLVIAGRFRYGTITGDVPATERYFAGGTSSQRGFPQRGLSPTAPSAPPNPLPLVLMPSPPIAIGGAGLVETSIEVRGPLGTYKGLELGGVAFLDGGNVTNTAAELGITNQFWATGVGLRWMSPIGAVGLDAAYRLNKIGEGGPEPYNRFNYLIAVGEAF